MNKIYKVIWSKVKHQYVVVSELAHSCTKSTSSRVGRSAAAVLAALVLTTGVCAVPVQAADPTLEELYYEQMNRAIQNGETSSPLVTLAEVPATTSAATEDGEPAAEEETQPGEDGSVTGTADQYTVTNKDGFYASNTKGTHNTLSKDGLWVGGTDDNTGFHVDNDGNVRTTGRITATSDAGDVIISNGQVAAYNDNGMASLSGDGLVIASDKGAAYLSDGNLYLSGNIQADSGTIGKVEMNDGKITANNGDIGGVVMNDGKVSANNGDIGGVIMNDGKVSANNGDIGGVVMNDGKVSANNGDIGGVVMNDGKVSANNGDIGGVVMNDGKVSANNGDIGGVVMNDGKVSANNGDIGGVMMNDGKVSANNGDIGGVMMNDGKVSANNGDIGGVVMNDGKVSANNGDIGGVVMNDGKVSANNGDIGGVVMNDGKVSANNGDIGGVVMNDGKVTAEKGDIGDIWLAEGNISNVKNITAERGTIGDVKLNDGKVTAEKGDIGDVWLSDGNISNVQNITAERGTIGDVKLVDGKVTAEKGDIGDVWLSEGNISNVQNIKAESGNIGDVKLADGKVTAQKADIGGVFIKNESIQAGNIKINENGSNEITGLSNTRWNDGTPVDEDRAATEGQLSTVQGYVDDLEKKTQHITHTATDNGHYTTIEDHTNFNSDGSIDAVDGQFRVTSDGGLMLKDEAGNETFRIYNGTGGMKAASGKFVVNGETGEVTVDESLSVGKHDDGTYAFTVDKAGNAEVDGTMVIQGQTIINADADIKGSLEAAGNKFKVDGITGEVTAPKGNIGGVILETTDDGKSKVSADKADIGGVIIKDKGIEAGTVQINKGSATDNRVIDVNGNFAVYNDGAFKAAGENFVVKATGDVTANSYTAGNVQINTDGHNTITGLSNVEWSGNAEDIVADRAATEGQLMTVQNDVQHISHETVDGMHYTKVEDTQIWNDGRIVTTGTVEAADAEFYADSQELVTAGQLYAAGIIPGEAKATPDKVNSQDSIAIGKGSNADIKATAIGSATSANQYSVVVGHQATADGIESVAVGRGASASNKGTVALGMYAKAEAKNAVALGTNSVADRADTVSVGSKDNERQITNVKAGKEDTDAVNVSQLKGVQGTVGDADFSKTNYASKATNVTDAIYDVDAQVKVNSDVLDGYEASGITAGTTNGEYGVAIGEGSANFDQYGVAIGKDAHTDGFGSVALGAHATVTGNDSVAIGFGSQATEDKVVSVGGYAPGTQRRVINVADGVNDNDAVNVRQLQAVQTDVGTVDFSDTNYAKTADNVTDAVKYVDA